MAKHNCYLLIITILGLFALSGCSDMDAYYNTSSPWNTPAASQEAPPEENVEATPVPQTPAPERKTGYETLPTVKVAILLPLSGPNGDLGQAMLQAAQLALFDIGYNNFQLIPRDTQGTAAGASQAATGALNDGAQLILGPLFADSVRAVKSVAQSRGVNVIAFSTDWALADTNTFIMGFMPFSQVDRVSSYATKHGYKNFALVAPRDNYADVVTKEFETKIAQNGGTLSKTVRFAANDPGVVAQIASVQGSGAQAVIMPVGGAQTEMISNILTNNQMPPTLIKRIGTGLWDDPRIAAQPSMQGAWFAAPSPRMRASFESSYYNTYGSRPPRIATLSYDATALSAALARNGFAYNGKPAFNRMAITNSSGFAGTDGVFRFKPNGLVERRLAVLEIRNKTIIELDPAASGF